jgi:hypothetical protein
MHILNPNFFPAMGYVSESIICVVQRDPVFIPLSRVTFQG